MRVERGAEAVNEGLRAGARIRPRAREVRPQVTLDLIEEDAQDGIEGLRVMLKGMTQVFAKRLILVWFCSVEQGRGGCSLLGERPARWWPDTRRRACSTRSPGFPQ